MTPKEVVTEFIRRCDAAASGGGGGNPYELLTEDVFVKVQGRTILAGDYPTREIVEMVLAGAVAPRVAKANVEILGIIAQGEKVATKLKITGETTDGKTYNPKGEPEGCIFYLDGDRIREVILFPDNTMVETVLLNRRYLPASEPAE